MLIYFCWLYSNKNFYAKLPNERTVYKVRIFPAALDYFTFPSFLAFPPQYFTFICYRLIWFITISKNTSSVKSDATVQYLAKKMTKFFLFLRLASALMFPSESCIKFPQTTLLKIFAFGTNNFRLSGSPQNSPVFSHIFWQNLIISNLFLAKSQSYFASHFT